MQREGFFGPLEEHGFTISDFYDFLAFNDGYESRQGWSELGFLKPWLMKFEPEPNSQI